MSIETLQQVIPDYAKDIRLNLELVTSDDAAGELTQAQRWGTALAAAYATRDEAVVRDVRAAAGDALTEQDVQGIKGAAALMGMNNIYYRFLSMVSDKEYETLRAGLRMNLLKDPGIPKLDFEYASLSVSIVNGCAKCVDAHVKQLEHAGASKQAVQSCIKIAAVIHAVAQVYAIERVEGVERQAQAA